MIKKRKPFDYVKSINNKEYIDGIDGFSPYMTHKIMSADKNFVMLANALNRIGNHKIPPKAIYDFYFHTVPKNKKWTAYPKSEKQLKEIRYVMEFYGITETTAKDYIELMDSEELERIIDFNEKQKTGGTYG